jgi:ABC-type proline/glycine betaine transport system permease subunit
MTHKKIRYHNGILKIDVKVWVELLALVGYHAVLLLYLLLASILVSYIFNLELTKNAVRAIFVTDVVAIISSFFIVCMFMLFHHEE